MRLWRKSKRRYCFITEVQHKLYGRIIVYIYIRVRFEDSCRSLFFQDRKTLSSNDIKILFRNGVYICGCYVYNDIKWEVWVRFRHFTKSDDTKFIATNKTNKTFLSNLGRIKCQGYKISIIFEDGSSQMSYEIVSNFN